MGLLDRLRSKRDETPVTAEASEDQTLEPTPVAETIAEPAAKTEDQVVEEIATSPETTTEVAFVRTVSRFGALRQAAQQARNTNGQAVASTGVDGLADIEPGEITPEVQEIAQEPAQISATLIIAAQRYAAALREVDLEVPDSVATYAALNFSDYVTFADLRVDTELILAARARRDHLRQTGEPVPTGISHLADLDPWAYLSDGQRREDFEQS